MNPLPFESTLLKPRDKIYWEESKNKSECQKSGAVFFPKYLLNKCMDYILTLKITYSKNYFNI